MNAATARERFAVYSQDYILVLNENGPSDVKQQAVGPVGCNVQRFPTRRAAQKFLDDVIIPDDRAEGYQTEHWIGRA